MANLRPRKQNHRQAPHHPALDPGDRSLAGDEAMAEATRDDRPHPRHQSPGFEPLDHLPLRSMTECVTSWDQPQAKPLKVNDGRDGLSSPPHFTRMNLFTDGPMLAETAVESLNQSN